MVSLDCTSFHSCGLTCTLMAHHGCWVSMVSSSLIPPPHTPVHLQLSVSSQREHFLLGLLSDPGFCYCPQGPCSVYDRQAGPSQPSSWPLSVTESSDFPCSTLLFLSPRLLRHSGPGLATCFLMSFTSNGWIAICAQYSLPTLLSLSLRAGTFSVLITG